MPIFRNHTTIEIAQGLKAFLTLEVGLTRGAVPGSEQNSKQESRIKNKNGQLEERIGALQTKQSEAVAGFELGSVPARETLYLGRPFVYPHDSAIGEIIARGGEWDSVLRTITSEILPEEEPTICEVGGNIGASLLQMVAAKPRARVVVFEPSTRFRPFLERNLELNGLDRVEVFPLLVGREPGSTLLYKDSTTGSVVSNTAEILDSAALPPGYEPLDEELVEMTTLDEVFRNRGPVDFIKVDTDGFDFEVLRGAETTLKRDLPVLHFELAPHWLIKLAPSSPAEGLAWLQSVGYKRFVCVNPAGQLVGTTDDPEQALLWANTHTYCDVLTCPEGSASEELLERLINILTEEVE